MQHLCSKVVFESVANDLERSLEMVHILQRWHHPPNKSNFLIDQIILISNIREGMIFAILPLNLCLTEFTMLSRLNAADLTIVLVMVIFAKKKEIGQRN